MDSNLKEMQEFAQYVANVLARTESAEALDARADELTSTAARLDGEVTQKSEMVKSLDDKIQAREAALAELEQRYGKIDRLADLDLKIASQTAKLKEINGAIQSARAKFATA